MIHIFLLSMVSSFVFCVGLAAHLRVPRDRAALIRRIKPVTRAALMEAYGVLRPRDVSAENMRLWANLHGLVGLWSMWVDAGIIVSVARSFAEDQPTAAETDYKMLVEMAFRLRWCLLFAVLEEAWLATRSSAPRLYARFSVELYLEMADVVGTLVEVLSPNLIDTFDSVLSKS